MVEVDATYYAPPSARNSALWAERTPPGFLFDVKAFSLLTGHPTRVPALPAELRPAGADGARVRLLRPEEVSPELRREVWSRFTAGLAPLADAGRLGGILLQFPPWFGPSDDTRAALVRWRERAGALRLAVEFRDPAWLLPGALARTTALLRDLGASLVAVDTAPGLPSSMPPVTAVTCPSLAVVRLHGRSPQWGTGSKEDRFRHRYTAAELRPWAARIGELADQAADVHVLFNNCCGDAAVTGAELMTRLLRAPGARPPA